MMAAVWVMYRRRNADKEQIMKAIGGFLILLAYCSLERGFSFGAVGALLVGIALLGFSNWINYLARTRRFIYIRS